MKVLFVCTGNMCRSAAAEKLALHLGGKAGLEARSRGTAAGPGAMPRPVREFLAAQGVPDLAHKPELIMEADVDWADLILVMENHHYEVLAERFPQSMRKMQLFLDYCNGGEEQELEDPMGKGDAAFAEVLGKVKAGVVKLVEKAR
jgi:protein-tyrosine phosphatase